MFRKSRNNRLVRQLQAQLGAFLAEAAPNPDKVSLELIVVGDGVDLGAYVTCNAQSLDGMSAWRKVYDESLTQQMLSDMLVRLQQRFTVSTVEINDRRAGFKVRRKWW